MQFGQKLKELHKKQNELQMVNCKYFDLESKYKDLGGKFQRLNAKHAQLQILRQENQDISRQENRSDLRRQKERCKKVQKQLKSTRQEQDQTLKRHERKQSELQKILSFMKTLQLTEDKNESKINELMQQNHKRQKLLIELQSKSQWSQNAVQQLIKPYKQRKISQ